MKNPGFQNPAGMKEAVAREIDKIIDAGDGFVIVRVVGEFTEIPHISLLSVGYTPDYVPDILTLALIVSQTGEIIGRERVDVPAQN